MTDIELSEILKQNKKFALIQYFVSIISVKTETIKKYELIYLKEKKLVFKTLSYLQSDYIKEKYKRLKLVISNVNDGSVWENNNFKEYYKLIISENKKII